MSVAEEDLLRRRAAIVRERAMTSGSSRISEMSSFLDNDNVDVAYSPADACTPGKQVANGKMIRWGRKGRHAKEG